MSLLPAAAAVSNDEEKNVYVVEKKRAYCEKGGSPLEIVKNNYQKVMSVFDTLNAANLFAAQEVCSALRGIMREKKESGRLEEDEEDEEVEGWSTRFDKQDVARRGRRPFARALELRTLRRQ